MSSAGPNGQAQFEVTAARVGEDHHVIEGGVRRHRKPGIDVIENHTGGLEESVVGTNTDRGLWRFSGGAENADPKFFGACRTVGDPSTNVRIPLDTTAGHGPKFRPYQDVSFGFLATDNGFILDDGCMAIDGSHENRGDYGRNTFQFVIHLSVWLVVLLV